LAIFSLPDRQARGGDLPARSRFGIGRGEGGPTSILPRQGGRRVVGYFHGSRVPSGHVI